MYNKWTCSSIVVCCMGLVVLRHEVHNWSTVLCFILEDVIRGGTNAQNEMTYCRSANEKKKEILFYSADVFWVKTGQAKLNNSKTQRYPRVGAFESLAYKVYFLRPHHFTSDPSRFLFNVCPVSTRFSLQSPQLLLIIFSLFSQSPSLYFVC